MAQVLIRGIQAEVVDRLRARARQHGRSLEMELRDVLRAAASQSDPYAEVDRVRRLFEGRTFADSAESIREDRDR